jgi:hypothetical protein
LRTQPANATNAKSKKQPKTSAIVVHFLFVVLPEQNTSPDSTTTQSHVYTQKTQHPFPTKNLGTKRRAKIVPKKDYIGNANTIAK